MKQLIEDIAKALVDIPEEVAVRVVEGEQVTVLELGQPGLRHLPDRLNQPPEAGAPQGSVTAQGWKALFADPRRSGWRHLPERHLHRLLHH